MTSNHRVSRRRVWCWAADPDAGWFAGWFGTLPRRAGCRTPPRCVRNSACALISGWVARAWRTDSQWSSHRLWWPSCAAPTACAPAAASSSAASLASPAPAATLAPPSSPPFLLLWCPPLLNIRFFVIYYFWFILWRRWNQLYETDSRDLFHKTQVWAHKHVMEHLKKKKTTTL